MKSEMPKPNWNIRKEPKDLKEPSAPFSLRSLRPLAAMLPLSASAGERAKVRCRFWFVASFVCFVVASAPAANFTSNTTISEANTSYDGQDIVIDGSITVTIDGSHAFNSLLLTNGAVLTHSPCTASATHKLDLTVTHEVVGALSDPFAEGRIHQEAACSRSRSRALACKMATTLPTCT